MDFDSHDEDNEEYRRFCLLAIDAVISSWADTKQIALFPKGFDQCANDFERVRLALKFCPLREFKFERNTSDYSKKDESESNFIRNFGNQLIKNHDYWLSVKCYTKALFKAERPSTKALAFANRSYSLYCLKMHRFVLQDIENALELGYPTELKTKLILRKVESLLALKRREDAKTELNNLLKDVEEKLLCPLSNDHLKRVCLNFKRCSQPWLFEYDHGSLCRDILAIQPLSESGQNAELTEPQKTHRKGRKHRKPRVSKISDTRSGDNSKCELKYSEKWGWHLVANQSIEPGQEILSDTAYVSFIHETSRYTRCARCYRPCLTLLPCRKCADVGFCSKVCEKEAHWLDWSNRDDEICESRPNLFLLNHRYECGQRRRLMIYDYAHWNQMISEPRVFKSTEGKDKYRNLLNIFSNYVLSSVDGSESYLAFSCLTRTSPKELMEILEILTEHHSKDELFNLPSNANLNDCNNSIKTILGRPSNAANRTPESLWQLTITAIFLAHCFKVCGYPIDWNPTQNHSDSAHIQIQRVATILLHLVQRVIVNGGISNETYLGALDLHLWNNPIFSLFPKFSMQAVKCIPNTLFIDKGDGIATIYASRVIKPQEPLCLLQIFNHHSLSQKHRRLFHRLHRAIECDCTACSDEWPNYFEFGHCCLKCIKCNRYMRTEPYLHVSGLTSSRFCHCIPAIKQQTVTLQAINAIKIESLFEKIDNLYNPSTTDYVERYDEALKELCNLMGSHSPMHKVMLNFDPKWVIFAYGLRKALQIRYGTAYIDEVTI